MKRVRDRENLESGVFLDIIRTQTEIARLGADPASVMKLVADRLMTLTHAEGVVVEVAEGEDVVCRAAAGIAHQQLGARTHRAASASDAGLTSGRVFRSDDCDLDDRVDRDSCRKAGFRSMAVAPLDHDGVVVGALRIGSSRAGAFSVQDIEVLELLSGMIAATIFHASRFESDALYHRATHDPLTGLANRSLFHERLRQALSAAARQGGRVGLLNLDMDGLKAINDQHGHRAGDAALRELATRLTGLVRQTDTVARVGGDEFAIILPALSNLDGARRTVERIERETRRTFTHEAHALCVEASVGVALYPDDGQDIEELVEAADRAMYAAKRHRRAREDVQPEAANDEHG
jgi:diguanylate cyclase (GGDEF)-like protein